MSLHKKRTEKFPSHLHLQAGLANTQGRVLRCCRIAPVFEEWFRAVCALERPFPTELLKPQISILQGWCFTWEGNAIAKYRSSFHSPI